MIPPKLSADAALFLDFDGCLVEIAPRPDAITVPPELPPLLARLFDRLNGAVALVSGRDVADLRRYLPDFPGPVAGSHGAELAFPGEASNPPADAQLDLDALHRAARDLAAAHDGLLAELKPHGVGLHYRARPDLAEWVAEAMTRLARDHPTLTLQPAKMALELRPAAAGKDRVLARLMERAPFQGRTPVFAGDDVTDEAAIVEAQARGGFGVKIGEGDSQARFRLPDPAAVARWLAT